MNNSETKSTKRCAHCNAEKPLTDFGHEHRKPDGRKSSCLLCMVEIRRVQYRKHRKKRIAATKAWRKRNPGRDLAYMRRYRRGIRAKIIEAYGGKCECCGETEIKFLTLEHREGGGRKHRGNRSSLTIYREIIKAGFPNIYTILCMNCNFAKGMYGKCPHHEKQN